MKPKNRWYQPYTIIPANRLGTSYIVKMRRWHPVFIFFLLRGLLRQGVAFVKGFCCG